MKFTRSIYLWTLLMLLSFGLRAEVTHVPSTYKVSFDADGTVNLNLGTSESGLIALESRTESIEAELVNGTAVLQADEMPKGLIYIHPVGTNTRFNGKLAYTKSDSDGLSLRKIPMWVSILPPLIAIFFALVFREVIISLFAGVFIGAWGLYGFALGGIFGGLMKSVEVFILDAFTDSGHAAVIIFSMLIGGMVAIISRNGGMLGVVKWLSRYANSARNAQFVTWFMGIAIFFDDYANTLIVGNTFRPITDKYRISREKLAYIVDSTAAPIAAVALVTTWIGAELGYIKDALEVIGIEKNEYLLFLQSLKYSYYPILTIIFIFMLIYLRRDYGAMYKAEHRARTTGELVKDAGMIQEMKDNLDPKEGIPQYAWNAILPVLTVIVVTILGLVATGMSSLKGELLSLGVERAHSWSAIWVQIPLLLQEGSTGGLMRVGKLIGSADSYTALLWASSSGVAMAIVLSLGTRTLSIEDSMNAMLSGFKTMLPTMIILILAWSLAGTTDVLHTADFLIASLSDNLGARWIPFITFILAAIISFSTGSSWSTMAILYPLALPLTWSIGMANGMAEAELMPIFYNVISVVLAGSVLGDHCSPISDTTVLSSLASSCDHIDHVRTQLPYAITVGGVSLLFGGILFALVPLPWYVNFVLGAFLLYAIIKVKGKVVHEAE